MADEKQSTPVVQDPLAEYDQKAAAPQEQDLPNYQGLVPAEDHEKTDHVLPKGLAVSKNNVHLPTGLVYDDDNTGHVKASAEEQKYESGPSAGQPVRAGDYQLRKGGPVINLISAGQEPGKITVHNPIMPLPGEEFQDTMKRAIEAGKKVTPAQIREEEEEDFLNAPGVMASAVALGATGPVIYGGAKGVSILKQLTVGGDSQILGHPENLMTPETQKAHPYWTGALEMAGGLSSPENAAMLIGSGALGKLAGPGAKVAQKMVSYGFGTAMVSGAIKKVPELWDVMQGTGQYEDMSDSDRESLAKKMVFHITADSAMGAMVLEHGITGENAPLTDIGEKTEALLSKQAQNISRIKFRAVADTVGEMFGKTSDFGKSIMRASNMLGKKAGPEFEVKVKNVSNDLKAVLNNDVNNKIVDPKSAAQAIDSHLKTAIDAPLLQEAGATKDSAEPVAPNFRKRLEERLDKFFQDTAGRYASGDQVEKAKERIIDRTEMQHDFGNGVTVPRDPNLFEAENIRQGLNAEGAASPFEDSANVESNAYKAAARETAAFMREVIDEAYDSKGVRGVKEARSKEADLIDIRDALFDSQRIADKQEATPGILKLFSLGKMAGMVGAIVAHFASSNLLSGALAAGTLWKHIHEGNVGDVVGNLERAKALAGRTPGAKATVPMPGGPELQGPSPAPPTPPVTPPPTAPEGFPAPPQPPAPVTPPQVNHRLYGALSSYFGEFLGSRPYSELLQEFSNQVADMRQDIKSQGGKYSQEQIDKASKLQEKINDAHGQEHESVAKQNATNQAKYEKEKIKYEQKLKAELAKQEQKRQTEDKQRTEQAKASLLKDERIAHSPVLKATDEPLEITGIEGRSSEQNHGHEHGHIMGASAEGLEPSVFVSDQHPDAVEDGAAAQVHIDTSMAEKGPKGVAQKVVAILSGPAFDEVHHDMKMSKNTGARDDISRARQLLRETGLRGGALETVFDALYDRAKEHVSNPEALAVAQANMRVREAGLSPKFHISAGRMAEYVKKLQGAYGNVKAQSTEVLREGDAGGGDEDGESDLAGRAGKEQAGAVKGIRAEALRESDEGGGKSAGESRRLAKAAISKTEPKTISDKLVDTYGTTSDPHAAGFILNDGRMVPLSNTHNEMLENLYNKYGDIGMGEAERTAFINNEQAVRTRLRQTKGGNEAVFSVPKQGVTPEQIEQIKKSVGKLKNGNVVMEVSEGEGKSAKKEFARVSDVEPMLREIGALGPEGGPEKPTWHSEAAEAVKEGSGFTVHPVTGVSPSKGYMVEVAPQVQEKLDHPATEEDIRNFSEKNKDLLAQHPELHVGGYNNELNVAGRFGDKDAAVAAAKKLDQEAIYDTEKGELIQTGGKNQQREFPEYPMEQRLADLTASHNVKASLTKSPKGSSVPLMDNPLEVKGSGEGGEVNTLDITKALNKFSRKSNPALEPGSEPKEMVERAKKIAEDEAKYQLAQSKTGTEWYTTEMKEHDNVLQRMRPELAGGEVTGPNTAMPGHPVKLTLFKAAEGILSSGQKPYANVKSAVKAWDLYKETGEFPRINPETGKSWGPRGVNAYGSAFDSVNKLIQEKGEKGAADWLLMEHPVKELRSYQASGQSPVKGKAADLETGAMILGAKRGPFMQNLHGVESKFTADMWVSRTWNRWMGTLDLDPRIEDKGKVTSASDAPRNNAERSLMRESFSKTADKLKLTTSSLQAVLWYYEQALYRAHGIPVESWSFSDAAKRVEKESAPTAEQESFPFGESAKGKGVEAGLGGVLKSKFANISGKNKP